MKQIIYILSFLFVGNSLFGQQDPLYNQYLYNPFYLNPAYTGNNSILESVLFHRSQWAGFEGAPTTQTLSVHGPLKNNKVGVGIQLVNDKIGTRSTIGFMGSYSYKIMFSDRKLSFGIRSGLIYNKANVDQLTYKDKTDDYLINYYQNSINPTFDFGLYYSSRKLFAGFTTTHLNQEQIFVKKDYVYLKRHYLALIGYTYRISSELIYKPTVLVRYTSNVPVNADLNCIFSYKNTFDFGVSYRTSKAISFMTYYKFSKKIWAGYSFDMMLNDINIQYRGTSHEVYLGYNLELNKQKTLTPRHL